VKQIYFWGVLYIQFLILVKYYASILNNFLTTFVNGLILKSNSLYFVINSYYFYFIIVIAKYNSILFLSSLLDIIIIDYPNKLINRFVIIYAFWNNLFNFRLYIRFLISSLMPVLSLSSFFSSSS